MHRIDARILLSVGTLLLASCASSQSSTGLEAGSSEIGVLDTGPSTDLGLPPAELGVDGPIVGPDRKSGEVTSGGGVSKGGAYTLFSQVGHAVGARNASGGDYQLHWNASVIPW